MAHPGEELRLGAAHLLELGGSLGHPGLEPAVDARQLVARRPDLADEREPAQEADEDEEEARDIADGVLEDRLEPGIVGDEERAERAELVRRVPDRREGQKAEPGGDHPPARVAPRPAVAAGQHHVKEDGAGGRGAEQLEDGVGHGI